MSQSSIHQLSITCPLTPTWDSFADPFCSLIPPRTTTTANPSDLLCCGDHQLCDDRSVSYPLTPTFDDIHGDVPSPEFPYPDEFSFPHLYYPSRLEDPQATSTPMELTPPSTPTLLSPHVGETATPSPPKVFFPPDFSISEESMES